MKSCMKPCRVRPIALAVMLLCASYTAYAEDSGVSVSGDQAAQAGKDLGEIVVEGKRTGVRDAAGYSKVYEDDISTVYAGKEEVERFKGSAPADVFRGMVGVNSGDARNSGALDPNVRGIQGQGRVPLTVDGTEQAITVYRGYNGANNRNYIDPMLIGGITVEKGPGLTRGVASSVGGGVAIKTLSTDDVILPGKDWGIDVKVEGSTNAVGARFPNLQYGSRVQSDKSQPGYNFNTYNDKALMVNPATGGRNSFGHDFAYRLAAAKKWQDFDVLFAYTARKKGNHFAGTRKADDYRNNQNDAGGEEYWHAYTKNMANIYRPGEEVPNTSTDIQSVLFKTTWKPTDNQSLQFGLRHTWGNYGEIMPSRLANSLADLYRSNIVCGDGTKYDPSYCDYRNSLIGLVPQWPESKIKMTAANLEHKWNPDNPYINLQTNLWTTRTTLDTYTSGGYPREAYISDFSSHNAYVDNPLAGLWRNTALTNSKDNRWGITTSNKFKLTPKLDLTVGGNYQYENMKSNDNWMNDPVQAANQGFRSLPRLGSRKEWDLNFRFDWRPTDWLELSAGARKTGYSSYDEQLARKIAAGKAAKENTLSAYVGDFKINTPEELKQKYKEYIAAKTQAENESGPARAQADKLYAEFVGKLDEIDDSGTLSDVCDHQPMDVCKQWASDFDLDDNNFYTLYNQYAPQINNVNARIEQYVNKSKNANDNYNHYKDDYIIASRNQFPDMEITEMNGMPVVTVKKDAELIPDVNGNLHRSSYPSEYADLISKGAYVDSWGRKPLDITVPLQWDTRKGDSGSWQPVLSASARLSENARVYARYAKAQRNPSIFETNIGFSAIPPYNLKPEKSTNIEVGYVHDLSELLKADRYADFKIAYFKNTIKDVIDRSPTFLLYNTDKQEISGLELQSRYNNGKFFADFSINYYLKNKVCDQSTALAIDPFMQRVPDCVEGGFYNSYLRNMQPPKFSWNLTLGGRFLDEKLEVGTRWIHQSGAKNSESENFGDIVWGNNVPIYWKTINTFDAWVSYKFKNNLTVELVGTNLTDRYYVDPLTRSHFPAPGRTFRIGINKKW